MIKYLLLIIPIYFYLIYVKKPKKLPMGITPRLYAHRGLFNNESFPCENSMQAFKLAVQNNYGIELDVQITKDGVPVVFHDKSLKRMCNVDKILCEINYSELVTYKLPCGSSIPLFIDVLNEVKGKIPLIVEIKHHGGSSKTSQCVYELLKQYKGDYVVESFDPRALLWFRKNAKHVIRGQLSSGHFKKEDGLAGIKKFIMQYLLVNVISRPNFIAYTSEVDNNISMSIIKYVYGSLLAAYTLKNEKQLNNAINKKYEMLIFEGFKPNK